MRTTPSAFEGTISSTRFVSELNKRTEPRISGLRAGHASGPSRARPPRPGSGRGGRGAVVGRARFHRSALVLVVPSAVPRHPAALTVPRQGSLAVPDEDRERVLERLPLAELGHQGLDVVPDDLSPLEQGVANPLDHVTLGDQERTDREAALLQQLVHLLAALRVAQGPREGR